MSHLPAESRPHTMLPQLQAWHHAGRKLVMVTAYDAATARIADAAGVDIILVGDSEGNVCLGFENTLPVSMARMNHHLEAVARTRQTKPTCLPACCVTKPTTLPRVRLAKP